MKQYEKAVEKHEAQQPITERKAKTAEKAREAKTSKKVRARLTGKTQTSVASRLSRAVAKRGLGNQKSYAIRYIEKQNRRLK